MILIVWRVRCCITVTERNVIFCSGRLERYATVMAGRRAAGSNMLPLAHTAGQRGAYRNAPPRQLVRRRAGMVLMSREGDYANVRLPSGEVRMLHELWGYYRACQQ